MSGAIEQANLSETEYAVDIVIDEAVQASVSETFSTTQLFNHAKQLATQFRIDHKAARHDKRLLEQFHRDSTMLRTFHASLVDVDESVKLPPESAWLLDNFHLVDEQLREIIDDLPVGYFRELPRLTTGNPRISEIASELVLHSDYSLDEEITIQYIGAIQSIVPLTIGELWAFPTMLRLTLVHGLREIAEQIQHAIQSTKTARSIASAWLSGGLLAFDLKPDAQSIPLIVALYNEFTDGGGDHVEALKGLQRRVRTFGWIVDDVVQLEQKNQAARQVAIGNIITSMRLISAMEWVAFFDETSVVEARLKDDPSRYYGGMDLLSRDRYRKVVERLAKRSRCSEVEIASKAIELAERASVDSPADAPECHVGYWLVDDGLQRMTAELNVRNWHFSLQQVLLRYPNSTYFGMMLLSLIVAMVAIASIVSQTSSFSAAALICLVLASLALSELALTISNLVVTNAVRPRLLPKLDFRQGIPEAHPTFVVVPCMLTSEREVDNMLARLEMHQLANQDRQFRFALLSDWADAAQETLPTDQGIVERTVAGIQRMNERAGAASRNNHQPFYLFHRRRQWNASEGVWMGWERKRGKLMEFGNLLADKDGEKSSYIVRTGDLSALNAFRQPNVRPYIITLDADTQLPHESAQRLVGTLAHPLNRAIVDQTSRTLQRGYAILQPRVSIQLESANISLYSRLHSDHAGLDPYVSAASDVYQDLFGEGSYTGKGIYDLRTFECCLADAFPENSILSHDLIEGCHARVGYVSDIELFDGYPSRYDVDAKRHHRWTRGDWQILYFLLPRFLRSDCQNRTYLSLISRWKVFDNLRRSMVAPALIAMLAIGWTFASPIAWLWSAIAVIVLLFPTFVVFAMRLPDRPRHIILTDHLRSVWTDVSRSAARSALSIATLPHRAMSMLDAITRTLFRLVISRRKLLEWQTAAATEWSSKNSLLSMVQYMWPNLAVSIALAVIIPRASWPAAFPWIVVWSIAPFVVFWISRPVHARPRELLDPNQQVYLRRLAYQTWSFFEAYLGPHDNWLPPDNMQEYPREKVARRISPTNEGLFLVSALAARDFGLIDLGRLVTLWERNLEKWTLLERHRGHFLNWYQTDTLHSLPPRYVSTVDSGNLAASLLSLRSGIVEMLDHPIIGSKERTGLLDTVEQLLVEVGVGSAASRSPRDSATWCSIRENLETLHDLVPDSMEEIADWSDWLHSQPLNDSVMQLKSHGDPLASRSDGLLKGMLNKISNLADRIDGFRVDLNGLCPWIRSSPEAKPTVSQPSMLQPDLPDMNANHSNAHHVSTPFFERLNKAVTLNQICELADCFTTGFACTNAKLDVTSHEPDASDQESFPACRNELRTKLVGKGVGTAIALRDRLRAIADQAEGLAIGMDFKFLYNRRRKLFTIGFNVDTKQRDRSHYDLLCSEARLASYFAIAKGDVPVEHWFRLGRPTAIHDEGAMLMSWGGTMFEYLMPPLFQRQFANSLLTQSCHTAIARQQAYATERIIPWGISESAFGAQASNSDYHYRSFGAPTLGIKRGLAKDLVVSPYSTLLALPLDPKASVENLQSLEAQGARGMWGFYDAIDYTPARVAKGKQATIVRCYMAHHQGMSLLGILNLLRDNVMQRRFHAHRLMQATELLLQERTPEVVRRIEIPSDGWDVTPRVNEPESIVSRRIIGTNPSRPRTHILASGPYSVMITSQGSGYSRLGDVAINRWRGDVTSSTWGQYIYLRDVESGKIWSPTYHPTLAPADEYEALFSIDKAEFRRLQGDLETRLEVTVSPENNAEIRQLSISNSSNRTRTIEVTTLVELALTTQAADVAHPAFQKLFIETDFVSENAAIIARRRPRDGRQSPLFAVHTLAFPVNELVEIEYETSRFEFIGRNRTLNSPQALERALSGTVGAVLDPVMSLRRRIKVPAGRSVTIGIATAVATTREEAELLADLYHDPRSIQRAFELAWAFTQNSLQHQHIQSSDAHVYQRLASHILYPDFTSRGRQASIMANRQGQSALWRYGVSGDKAIVLVRVSAVEDMPLVRQLCKAHRYWGMHGLDCDLIVLNEYPGSYLDELQETIVAAVQDTHPIVDSKPTGVFVLRGAQLPADDILLLEAVAACVLVGNAGTLSSQIDSFSGPPSFAGSPGSPGPLGFAGPPGFSGQSVLSETSIQRDTANVPTQSAPGSDGFTNQGSSQLALISNVNPTIEKRDSVGEFDNGFGRFVLDGSEYEIQVGGKLRTPLPWSNVIANEEFGCLITESGGGYSWARNSRENKLTEWSNDPVGDMPSERLWVRDEVSQETWSPMPVIETNETVFGTEAKPIEKPASESIVRFGVGSAAFHKTVHGIKHETRVTLAGQDPIKLVRLRLKNLTDQIRTLSIFFSVDWVLGVTSEMTRMHLVSQIHESCGAILAMNQFHPDFPDQVAFLHVIGDHHGFTKTANRAEVLGIGGSNVRSSAMPQQSLSGTVGAGLDPCGALQANVQIGAGQVVELTFMLGCGRDRKHADALLARYSDSLACNDASDASLRSWNETLLSLQIQTPNRRLDLLVNRWLLYQVFSCRIWGRSGFYQSSGAYGFRDQLQDVMAIVYSRPDIAREHILRAAARQYIEGDVQHWWHPASGRGTRTRFSDDLLWLPLVTAHYVRVTGNTSILDEVVTFIESPILESHEHERYEMPRTSEQSARLYEHCLRALERGCRFGEHGLPLMGCGDWNDGMNNVGKAGRGESVWVGWFLLVIFDRFLPLAKDLGDHASVEHFSEIADRLRQNLEQHAWDGEWYLRAFFDDGSPLGSHVNQECSIDSLPQSWSVFAQAQSDRSATALQSTLDRLVDKDRQVVQLFAPPFNASEVDPGYIKGYVPGIRENGGQYTHAATWLIAALAQIGRTEEAMQLMDMINPITHSQTRAEIQRYKVEPYVMAADVYAVDPHAGRGGWTWYTGTAAWMYRVAIEWLLGFEKVGDTVIFRPRLPADWNEYTLRLRTGKSMWTFTVQLKCPEKQIDAELTAKVGEPIQVYDDGRDHHVVIESIRSECGDASSALMPP